MNRRATWLAPALALALALALATAPAAAQETTPGARSMAFEPGLGETHERVPGGRLLAIAYGVVLLVLGGYVAFIARKAARIGDEVERLEADLARRGGGDVGGDAEGDGGGAA